MAKYFTKNESGEFVEIEVDDANELKEALRKEREEHKSAKQKAKELEDAKNAVEEERLLKQQEFEKLWNAEKASKEQTFKELTELKEKIANKEREALADKVIIGLTKDTGRAELLKRIGLDFIQATPDGIGIIIDGVMADEGKLSSYLTEKYPFLVDGHNSSGGGAKGSSASFGGKKWSEMTEAEHVALFKKDKDAAMKLINAEKKKE